MPNDFELEEIADRIKEGYTSGLVDGEGGRHVSWDLKTEEWGDDEDDEKDSKPLTIRDIIKENNELYHYDCKWNDSKNYKDLDEALEECGYRLTGDDDVKAGDYNDIKAYLNCEIEYI